MKLKVNYDSDNVEITGVQKIIRLTEQTLEKLERKIFEAEKLAAAIINKTLIEEYRTLRTFGYYKNLVNDSFDTLCRILYPSLKYFGTCEMFSGDANSCNDEDFSKLKEESQRQDEEDYAEYILIAEKMQEEVKEYRKQAKILRKSLAVLRENRTNP